jgi:hypothetical protein
LASFVFSRFEAYKHLKIKDIRVNILLSQIIFFYNSHIKASPLLPPH